MTGGGDLVTPRGQLVWDPSKGRVPLPIRKYTWVLAPTMFLHSTQVARPLTDKEMGQILDIREDWGARIARLCWSVELQGGNSHVPLRLPLEFVQQTWSWFEQSVGPRPSPLEAVTGWDHRRVARTVQHPTLFQAVLKGCFWEPSDALDMWLQERMMPQSIHLYGM
jgi:hypothetical protein